MRECLAPRRHLGLLALGCVSSFATAAALAYQSIPAARDQIHQANRRLPEYNSGSRNLVTAMLTSPNKSWVFVANAPYRIVSSAELQRPGDDVFAEQVCEADAVVTGSVSSIKPLLSADESMVFTDYGITVESVIRNQTKIILPLGAETIVTQPGGRLHVDGGTIEMSGDFFPPALYPGKKYLLLLSLSAKSKTFMIKSGVSTYVDDDGRPRAVTPNFWRDRINNFLFSIPWSSLPNQIAHGLLSCRVIQR